MTETSTLPGPGLSCAPALPATATDNKTVEPIIHCFIVPPFTNAPGEGRASRVPLLERHVADVSRRWAIQLRGDTHIRVQAAQWLRERRVDVFVSRGDRAGMQLARNQ